MRIFRTGLAWWRGRGSCQEVVVSGLDCAKVVGWVIVAAIAAPGENVVAGEIDPDLETYLAYCAGNYSETHQMLGTKFQSPGYHSTVPGGTWVHPTRQSLGYAVALLARGTPADVDRAEKIIAKVLSLQDTNPSNKTYGIWPWLLEEPLPEMSPPDWNWADFLGAQLAVALTDYRERLSGEIEKTMREALGHAGRAIRKRNVQPGYTNIAIMGGGVCAAAGEILDDPELLAYGRDRLDRCVNHASHHGSFTEYNSPTYTRVALAESERILHLVADPGVREAAESLRRTAWRVIADSFHPGTGQWAGPHSRAYSNHLDVGTASYLSERTGATIRARSSGGETTSKARSYQVAFPLLCPDDLRSRFRELPTDPLEVVRTFVRGDSPEKSTIGTTWHTATACLGSVSQSTLWTQRRPLIGYWRTEADPAVVFRMRFLHDGKDFASMAVRSAQRGGRVLSVYYPARNQGDWHPTLDRPADGVFPATDFRVRYELCGEGVGLEELEEGRFALTAGDRRAVIHTLPGRFAGEAVVWQGGRAEGRVFVDGICHQGPKKDFNFRQLDDVLLAAGAELLASEEAPAGTPVVSDGNPDIVEVTWQLGEQVLRVSFSR